jgi:hypothetical protein
MPEEDDRDTTLHLRGADRRRLEAARTHHRETIGDLVALVLDGYEAYRAKVDRTKAVCVNCGCTPMTACVGGCSWDYFSEPANAGLCSVCLNAMKAELSELQPV